MLTLTLYSQFSFDEEAHNWREKTDIFPVRINLTEFPSIKEKIKRWSEHLLCFPEKNINIYFQSSLQWKVREWKHIPDISRTNSSKIFYNNENETDLPKAFSERLYDYLRGILNINLNYIYLLRGWYEKAFYYIFLFLQGK